MPSRTDWSLRKDFAWLLVLAVVLPVVALAAWVLWQEDRIRREQTAMRLVSVGESSAGDVEQFLRDHLAAVQLIATRRSEEGNTADVALWRADLARIKRFYPAFSTMLVTDADGTVRTSVPVGPPRRTVADRAYFQVPARTGQAYVLDAFRGRVLGNDPLVGVSAPLWAQGRFDGVVEGSIAVADFAGVHTRWLHERGYEVLLLDRNDTVVHVTRGLPYRPLDRLGTRVQDRALAALPPRPRDGDGAALLRDVLAGGGDAYAVAVPLQSGWRLLVFVPKRTLDAEARAQVLTTVGIGVLLLGSVLAAAWWQLRRLGASMNALLERMERFALDEDHDPIEAAGVPRELVPLTDALNRLGERAIAAYREVRLSLQEQSRLRESLERVVSEREREIRERTDDLRRAVAKLDHLSRTDPLTGALNRRGFEDAVRALEGNPAPRSRPVAVLAIDIDRFKAYNDRYGHPEGDVALRRVTGAIRSALRDSGDVLARVGGEEYTVLLPDDDLAQAHSVAERIRQAVRGASILHADAPDGVLTVSIGVAVAGEDEPALAAAIARADQALYRAKRAGRDRVSE
ncbi:sensor domain-containing diguanylate cyclase [Vulcaniibacterium gelatinicum]|uniref:sensor domain-containing diguanylate cyclase n=1 Tax=Vulcaniibacterium gelatinicum TaxID=2598725 RepID=UPI0011C99761|nr:diguanylate cyclase [Vulcaniibacterium gelatinicum]